MDKPRTSYIDVLRIIAIICVLFNHQSIYSHFLDMPFPSISGVLVMVFSIITKIGPPLFFMISGALLLGKDEPYKQILRRRVLRILIVMAVRTVLILILMPELRSQPIAVFMSGNIWFLYAYLGFLLMLPFLRLIAKNATQKEQQIFITLSVICCLVSGITQALGLAEGFTQFLPLNTSLAPKLCENIIFPLTGYFLYKGDILKTGKDKALLAASAALHLAVSAALIAVNMYAGNTEFEHMEALRMYFVLPLCTLVFVIARDHISLKEKTAKITAQMAGVVFGIFILDTTLFPARDIENAIADLIPGIPLFINCTFVVLAEFIAFGAITYLLRLIPPVKKIL